MAMRRSQSAASRQFDTIFDSLLYCPSCTTWRLTRPSVLHRSKVRNTRHQSTWGSSTAINGTQPVPTKFKQLHEALSDVRKKASAHVSLSRLQLAIQSLETNQPKIRLAILGYNVPDTARRLARLLLADPLEDEGGWEKQLANGTQDFSRGLIIRYGQGDNPQLPRPKTSVPILYIPSTILEKNNIEILVSSINGPSHEDLSQTRIQTPSDTFLSPVIGTPTSESGRQVTINQPAHRCLVVTEGLDHLVAVAELLASTRFTSIEDRDSVMVAVNLESAFLTNPDRKTLVMDTKKAEEGLAAIRKSVSLATEYEHKWIDSGMPALSKWLTMSAAAHSAENGQLSQPVRDLILSLLTTAIANLQNAALKSSKAASERSLPPAVSVNLEDVIDQFSRSAHQELQSGLASAWRSRNWRKLAWYKLFWRVDDVGLIITDLVNNAWLPKTERAVYELSGRLIQVGVNPVTESPAVIATEPGQAFEPVPTQEIPILQPDARLATAAIEAQPTQPVIVNQTGKSEIQIHPIPQPIPLSSSISRTRTTHISNAITTLTTTAQQLVLRALSITGLSAGLSGLTYVSLVGSVYEAGTIAAVGTVFALWRMQGGWQKATRQLENDLFNEGRSLIVDIVERMRTLVQLRARVEVDPVEVEGRMAAEDAVVRARMELERLDGRSDAVKEV